MLLCILKIDEVESTEQFIKNVQNIIRLVTCMWNLCINTKRWTVSSKNIWTKNKEKNFWTNPKIMTAHGEYKGITKWVT